jgi:hypothetical protein
VLHLEALLRLRLDRGQRGVQPLAQHPELQGVEDLVHLVAVPLPEPQVLRVLVERDVPHQLGQLPVAHDAGQSRAQVVADLALHLVDVVDEGSDVAVLLDQLGGGLLARGPGCRAGCRWGRPRSAANSGYCAGDRPYFSCTASGVMPAHVGHAAGVVEDGHPVADELEGVPVAGDDQDVHAVGLRLGGQRGDDVVGLEALGADDRHPQRVEHLADQRHLALEVGRRLGAAGLVVGVGLGAEGRLRDVEGDRDVRRVSSRRTLMSIAVKP